MAKPSSSDDVRFADCSSQAGVQRVAEAEGDLITRHELQTIIRQSVENVADDLMGIAPGVPGSAVRNTATISSVIDRLLESKEVVVQSIIDKLRLEVSGGGSCPRTDDETPSERRHAFPLASANEEFLRQDESEETEGRASARDTNTKGRSSGRNRARKRKRTPQGEAQPNCKVDAETLEVLNALPPEERAEQLKALTPSNEVKSLMPHNRAGLHGTVADQDITLRIGRKRSSRSACQQVIERKWDDHADHNGSQPIHFVERPYPFPKRLIDGVDQLKQEIVGYSERKPSGTGKKLIEGLEEQGTGYFKGHIPNSMSNDAGTLPGSLQVKRSAERKGMIFYNRDAGQCITHYDRDTSLLLLLAGKKTVMIAPPAGPNEIASSDDNASLYNDVDPFVEEKRGKWAWERVCMDPNDALFIPKRHLHSIRSEKGAVAISLQVEAYNECTYYPEEAQQLDYAIRLSQYVAKEAKKKAA